MHHMNRATANNESLRSDGSESPPQPQTAASERASSDCDALPVASFVASHDPTTPRLELVALPPRHTSNETRICLSYLSAVMQLCTPLPVPIKLAPFTCVPSFMATAGMRVLVLAVLEVGLLAVAVSGARDAMKVARGLVPEEGGDGAAPGGVGAGQQRKGARILAAETFAHHAPLPDYLDHIPRRQALATSTCCCSLLSLSILPWFLDSAVPFLSQPVPALLASHFSAFLASHFSALLASHSLLPLLLISLLPLPLSHLFALLASIFSDPLTLHFSAHLTSHFSALLGSHFSSHLASHSVAPLGSHFSAPIPPCGRTIVTIRSQYLGPYDLHNDIYNMTFYNGCAYNVTSPLRVWQCFNFYNIWEGVLANPTQYQTGDIFVQTLSGYCEMRMNRGASGKLQMLPKETVNIVYAHTWDFRPCVQELRFGNGNSYSMTNTTECQLAKGCSVVGGGRRWGGES
ncbi:unnamed protein product [Closterium sp. NIES-53]